MTTKLILVNTDTHVVVPKKPTEEQIKAVHMIQGEEWATAKDIAFGVIEAAPQLTTPPVLRWEGVQLLCGNYPLAEIGIAANKLFYYVIEDIEATQGYRNTIDEARRAAEKALGLPEGLIISEV